ncbi:MAG: RodZ domain-containing protein [Pseudomonadota bacterium]
METSGDIGAKEGPKEAGAAAEGPANDVGDPEAGASAGALLREAREARRLSLDHVAAETRIPIRHLETVEAGEFDALPSRTYAIGFARSYARAVGLDDALIAERVREEMGNSGPRYASLTNEMEPGDPAKLPSSGLAWFGGIAALVLAFGVIVFSSTYFGAGTGPASLLADAGLADGEGAEPADPSEVGEAAGASLALAPSADGQVVFTALEDGVWVRFYEDGGERLFEAQMASGDTFELPLTASEPRINTGRPDAFSITIDGRSVPKLADEPVTMGDTPISAAALLARPRT